MQLTRRYATPLGEALIACDEAGITGLWFKGALHEKAGLEPGAREGESPLLDKAVAWLDAYFAGEDPGPLPPLHLSGTPFQQEVWTELAAVPYGETVTYGAIARTLAERRGVRRMAAQAVGGAVARNPVSVIVPCHRVVAQNRCLTGYAGGLDKKIALLRLEGHDADEFVLPVPKREKPKLRPLVPEQDEHGSFCCLDEDFPF